MQSDPVLDLFHKVHDISRVLLGESAQAWQAVVPAPVLLILQNVTHIVLVLNDYSCQM